MSLNSRCRMTARRTLHGCFIAVASIAFFDNLTCAGEVTEAPISQSDREHWAFRPLVRPDVPAVGTGNAANPIDAFLGLRLREKGLATRESADKFTLLRRVSFDLVGLPPTPDEISAFLEDKEPDAHERVVDRLLASPGFGERWAQHWLDLARFAETDGFEHDKVRPEAWRYRDWVIEAFNGDLPLDRFVQQQIAGDELWPDDPRAAIATGFLLSGPDMPDINDQEERRHTLLNEMAGTVGSVFLGLSVGCAQCHNHKTDPISQPDFYRLRAFFDRGDIFRDHPIATPDERSAHEAARGTTASLEKELKQLDDAARKRLREQNPDLQPTAADLKHALTPDESARRDELAAELARSPKVPELPQGRVFRNGPNRPSFVAVRGDFQRAGAEVQPAFLRIAESAVRWSADSKTANSTEATRDGQTEGRLTRSDLAHWLTRPDHPLVPRVMANRLWQFHMADGLCRTPSDFGFGGSEPTHPELLDWLATELPRDGASMKRWHRLIVTSAAYRQPSRSRGNDSDWANRLKLDPDNRLYSRMNRRRLEGESLRDAMLSMAGLLSDERGGPGVMPPLPDELVSTLLKGQWKTNPRETDHYRRSIHLFARRNLRYPLFEAFDRPDANASCPVRDRSTTAPQSLVLFNSELSLQVARHLAGRILDETSSVDRQVDSLFRLAYARPPTGMESREIVRFLTSESERIARDGRSEKQLTLPVCSAPITDVRAAAALVEACLAVLNSSEMLYVD
jgi:Protein of unknown function (DUF1553)/Protein of unknown function (DUF1549)